MPSFLSKALTVLSVALSVAALPQLPAVPGLPAVPAVPAAVPAALAAVEKAVPAVPGVPGVPALPAGGLPGLSGLVPAKRQSSYTNLERDQAILLQLALLITVDPTGALSTWTPDNSVCSYTGVTCQTNADGIEVVAVIDFTGFGFAGVDLTLDLFVGLLDLVELRLSANVFVGIVPDFSVLVYLQMLDLSYNQLSGGIELLVALDLDLLDIRFNLFVGILGIDLFVDLSIGTLLIEGNVGITGGIPNFTACAVTSLSLANCNLVGQIPLSIALAVQLTEISFAGNLQLTGVIPDVLCALPLLTVLDVSGTGLDVVNLGPLCSIALQLGVLII
jgi:hypothetical protein